MRNGGNNPEQPLADLLSARDAPTAMGPAEIHFVPVRTEPRGRAVDVWCETIWLRGEVPDARLVELANPDAKLTETEEAIWRRNLAHWYATKTDICSHAPLVPVSLEGEAIYGYAVFVTGQGHPEDTPVFGGCLRNPRRGDPPFAERGRHRLA